MLGSTLRLKGRNMHNASCGGQGVMGVGVCLVEGRKKGQGSAGWPERR